MNEKRIITELQIAATYIRKYSMRFTLALPMNPKRLLSPTLSSFLGRRGRRGLGQHEVQEFNARNWLRGILTPAISPSRNDAVSLGERARAADGVSPSASCQPSGPSLVAENCKTRFAARRRKPHAGGVCSPFPTEWLRLNADTNCTNSLKLNGSARGEGKGTTP